MPESETSTDFHTINESIARDLRESQPGESVLENLEEQMKGLANLTRLKIIWLLSERDLCVHDLSALLDMSQSAVSHQLKKLKNREFVTRRKDGRVVYYSLNEEALRSIQGIVDSIL